MATQNPTTNYGWSLPLPGASIGAWGEMLNTILGDDVSGIDKKLKDVSAVADAALPKAGGTVTGALTVQGATKVDGGLTLGVYTLISATRALANVTADAAIITSGAFHIDRIPSIPWSKLTGVPSYEPAFAKNTAFNKAFGTAAGTVAEGNHSHTPAAIGAEPAFAKNTAFNKSFGTAAGTVAEGNHAHTGVYEPAFTKGTAFNKNFGSVAGTVCDGADARLSDARTPTAHNHSGDALVPNSVQLGGTGASLSRVLTGTLAITSASIAAGSHSQHLVTVTGAADGDAIMVHFDSGSMPLYYSWNSADTILVGCHNTGSVAQTLAAQTIRVLVFKVA